MIPVRAENKFGTGCRPEVNISFAASFDDYAKENPIKIDWDSGYDIRNVLGGDIPFKNQMSASSCVGNGVSYKVWEYQVIEMMNKYGMDLEQLYINHPDEIGIVSAKAIYSQIRLSGGGAYIGQGINLVCDWGSVTEEVVPSYRSDGTTDEAFYSDKTWKDSRVDALAKILQGKEPRIIMASDSIDLMAQAILQTGSVVGGVYGENNGTWMTERPKPPTKVDWAHCIYIAAFGKDQYGKFIAFPNSWGNLLGKKWYKGAPPGYGWQKIYENYFGVSVEYTEMGRTFQMNGVFNPYTYTDKLNITDMSNQNVKLVKEDGGSNFALLVPLRRPSALLEIGKAYGLDVKEKADGTLDWSSVKTNGTYKLN